MNEITVNYPASVYEKTVVEQAIADYRGICRIRLRSDGREYVCVFSRSRADLELTALEFTNYLIELSNSRNDILYGDS